MPTEKIAITLDRKLLREIDRAVKSGVYRNRSRAVEEAVREKLQRHRKRRLSIEAKKLDPEEERALAEEGMTGEEATWPEYCFPLTHQVESLKMPKPSWVKIGQVRTLSVERLGKRIGSLSPEEVSRIVDGLFELVG